MKTTAMRAQSKKVNTQLKLKAETGDDLHEVDFDQLKIENTQYVERIEERNKASSTSELYHCLVILLAGGAGSQACSN